MLESHKNKISALVLLALSQGVAAQQIPSAGSQLQQIAPPPVPQKAPPQMAIEPVPTAPAKTDLDQVKLPVRHLQVSGAQAYSPADLIRLTGFEPDSELTLSKLQAMASKIAGYYQQNGYFLAQAYLPAQDIEDGTVTIAVMEGRYGAITLRNEEAILSKSVTDAQLGGLNSGAAITAAPLERRLLLLSDIPGVNVKSTLVPGASVGTSDLIVDVTPGQRFTGSLEADNHGSRYTGEQRIGAMLNVNNPSGHGDVASLRVLTAGSGLNYGRAAYQAQLGQARAGMAYAAMHYALGRDFESLQASGSVRIASLYASYPLLRSRSANLNAQLAFDAKAFEDRQDATATLADKKARVWMASLNGDWRDTVGGGGLSTYALTWTTGSLDLQTPAAFAADKLSSQSNGRYNKLGLNASRLQSVSASTTLYAAISGQVASKNLDSSEKMGLGGASAVRAYPEGQAYGDQGYVLTLEARTLLPRLSAQQPGQLQLIGFIDTGRVTLDKKPWSAAAGQNSKTFSGAGIGLNWTDNVSFVVKAYYARKLGSAAAASAPDAKSRLWIQAVRYF